MKMTSSQQQGLLLLFVCSCFLGEWGGVHAFDLTCKFHLDKQLGFKSHAHRHVQMQTHTNKQPKRYPPPKKTKNKKSVTISIWIIIQCKLLVKIKSAPPPQADHLFWLVQPYYKVFTYMIFHEYSYRRGRRKKKK